MIESTARPFRRLRDLSVGKMAFFVGLGILILQIALFMQLGRFGSPAEFPGPFFVGVAMGMLFGLFYHSIVADTRQAKRELAEKEKLLNALSISEERLSLATSRSSIWDWALETDELYMSPWFAKSLGYTEPELRAAMRGSTANLLHPDDVERYRAKLSAHLDDPSKGFLNEQRFRTKSGAYKWFLAIGQSITDRNGKVVRFNGTTTDVSERVNLESRLHQAERMEAIGKLSGGIAHDFNNLLAVIMGNLELLQSKTDDPELLQTIDAGLKATQRGANLSQNMLSFARQARLTPKNIDLNDVVRTANEWMRRGLPTSIEIELSLQDKLWPVCLDAVALENAILNLLINASDAMDSKGKLTIKTLNLNVSTACPDSRGRNIAPGQYVLLSVNDTGTGIPAEALGNIFDPFFSTKGLGKGSGMGLSMVEGFVSQSGGTVQVFTVLGEGTTFKLYFPIASASVPLPAPVDKAPGMTVPANGAHVLLVQAGQGERNVAASSLKAAGYRVTQAHSGDEALEVIIAKHSFDVMVTDMTMPGKLQGGGLAIAVKALNPDMPVIFMSGAPDSPEHDTPLGPEDIHLMKPFRKEELLNAVAQVTRAPKGKAG